MRLGIVRTDLGYGIHVDDLDSRNQYPYAEGPHGQARTFRRPTDAEFLGMVRDTPLPVAVTGLNTATAVDTRFATGGLALRSSPGGTFASVGVGGTSAALKTYVRDQLNAGFASGGLPYTASVVGTNQIRVTSTITGQAAYLEFQSQGSAGYTGALNFVLGIPQGTFAAAPQPSLAAALKSAVYTGAAFNVSTGAIANAGVTGPTGASQNFGLLATGALAAFRDRVAEAVAPAVVESGDVLLSFANGKISRLRSSSYTFKGVAGAALYATLDDGVTPYNYP